MHRLVVYKCYELTDSFYNRGEENLDQVHKHYRGLANISRNSTEQWIKPDNIIVDRKSVRNDQEMFRDHMIQLHTHYHSQPNTGLLYMDADTVVVGPVEGLWDKEYYSQLGGSCGVRYYPPGLPEEFWTATLSLAALWDVTQEWKLTDHYQWDHEQDIYRVLAGQRGREEGLQDWVYLVGKDNPQWEGQPIIQFAQSGKPSIARVQRDLYAASMRKNVSRKQIRNIIDKYTHEM
jgi:hypothetical protein